MHTGDSLEALSSDILWPDKHVIVNICFIKCTFHTLSQDSQYSLIPKIQLRKAADYGKALFQLVLRDIHHKYFERGLKDPIPKVYLSVGKILGK